MYAKIINQETKQCEVGLGTNAAFYQKIGMTEMEVEQAYNGIWYVKGYAPEEPEAEKKAKRRAELVAELAQIDLESIRPTRAIQNGTATEFDTQKLAELEERAEQIRQEIRDLSEVKLDKEEEFD